MEREIRENELADPNSTVVDHKHVDAEFGSGLETGEYQLISVVTHKGRSADGGHYVGWANLKGDDWAEYDDDVVHPRTIEDILNLKGGGDWHMAYYCVYRKLQLIPQQQVQ